MASGDTGVIRSKPKGKYSFTWEEIKHGTKDNDRSIKLSVNVLDGEKVDDDDEVIYSIEPNPHGDNYYDGNSNKFYVAWAEKAVEEYFDNDREWKRSFKIRVHGTRYELEK